MKKFFICILVIFLFQGKCFASEILNEVTESIGINDFLEESEKYLNESNIDIKNLFKETLASGEIDKSSILNNVKSTIKNSFKEKLSVIIEIIIIIIIHAILKSIISEVGQTRNNKNSILFRIFNNFFNNTY